MKDIFGFVLLIFILCSCNSEKNRVDWDDELMIVNTFMDNWHHSAAIADEDFFFGSLDVNAVYLGTDPSERWLKHEFMDWGLKYFERDTAWAFTSYDRRWEFSDDLQYAWFDELLETHMGICRGSGVLKRHDGGWKIKQYNLALTLPNDQMDDFRVLVGVEKD
jgi:SnoaL-like protein